MRLKPYTVKPMQKPQSNRSELIVPRRTPEEEKQLLDLMARGELKAAIAKVLQRTEAAIEGRAHTLKNRADPALRPDGKV
jgi:DNA-binding NarL/FixJ family response regulator